MCPMRTVARQYTLTRFLGQCSLSLGHNHNKEFHFTNNIGKSTISKIDQSANVSISLRLYASKQCSVLCSICTRRKSQCHPANGVGICVNPLRQCQCRKGLSMGFQSHRQSASSNDNVNAFRGNDLNVLLNLAVVIICQCTMSRPLNLRTIVIKGRQCKWHARCCPCWHNDVPVEQCLWIGARVAMLFQNAAQLLNCACALE